MPQFVFGVLCLGYLTFVIVYSGVARDFRNWVTRNYCRADEHTLPHVIWEKLEELFHCPFCTGFWLSVGYQFCFVLNMVGDGWLPGIIGKAVSLIATTFALAGCSAIVAWVYGQALKYNWSADNRP